MISGVPQSSSVSASPLLRSTIAIQAALGVTCVLAAAIFAHTPSLQITVLMAAMMAIILSGITIIRRRLSTCIEIDSRLAQLAMRESFTPEELLPLTASDRAATGWNRLVESACVQRLLDSATSEVSSAPSSSDSMALTVLNALPDAQIVTDSMGLRVWENSATGSLLEAVSYPGGDLLRFHELFRSFFDFDQRLTEFTDYSSLAPLVFELRRGEKTAEGVLRISRQCLSEAGPMFLWTVRDVTQQKLSVEMRDCFVSAATHELRTPLCNIRTYAETLIGSGDISPDDQQQFLNVIVSESIRLDRIIEDLLNIGHMQAGSMTLDRHETQVDRLVREVHEKIRPLYEHKHLHFEASIPPRLPELLVDKNKLAAALVNLLGNAIKYTPDGGSVRLLAEHDGNEVRFHVEDTGIGIAEEEIPHLFERFYRSADPRVHEIQGTGLGLAFSMDVARLHGGRIDVASELNKGSRFTLVLPSSLASIKTS
ncbi:MAG: ATP-binding protein [Planctomycetaceae bacterium]